MDDESHGKSKSFQKDDDQGWYLKGRKEERRLRCIFFM